MWHQRSRVEWLKVGDLTLAIFIAEQPNEIGGTSSPS